MSNPNSAEDILATLRDYLADIPSGPWDRKIMAIKMIVGDAPVPASGVYTVSDDSDGGTYSPGTVLADYTIHHLYLSSDGVHRYDVIQDQDKNLTCSCKGFQYRKTCRHVKELGATLG